MLSYLLKAIPIIIFLTIFGYVIFNVDYPKSVTGASFYQLTAFFGSLFFLLLFLINIFLNYLLISLPLALGLVILLVLQGLISLRLVSSGLVITAVWLFISYFKKNQKKNQKPKTGSNPIKPSLTSKINIPRLKNLTKTK